jgi:hypothetical protein
VSPNFSSSVCVVERKIRYRSVIAVFDASVARLEANEERSKFDPEANTIA